MSKCQYTSTVKSFPKIVLKQLGSTYTMVIVMHSHCYYIPLFIFKNNEMENKVPLLMLKPVIQVWYQCNVLTLNAPCTLQFNNINNITCFNIVVQRSTSLLSGLSSNGLLLFKITYSDYKK